MPIIFEAGALLRSDFSAADFTATEWDPAAMKAKFANDLCRFMVADFKESLFTQRLCRRLSQSFGHIAWYDHAGFFAQFFRDLRGKVRFIEEILMWHPCGDPAFTWCDVGHAVQKRLRASGLLAACRALQKAEIAGAGRELLRRLQEKYHEGRTVAAASVLQPGRPIRQDRQHIAREQTTLFWKAAMPHRRPPPQGSVALAPRPGFAGSASLP